MIRTTVRLDEDLFKDARKKAIDERVPFAQIVNEALAVYLGNPPKQRKKKLRGTEFLAKIAKYHIKGGPKDLAKNHDKYLWDHYRDR